MIPPTTRAATGSSSTTVADLAAVPAALSLAGAAIALYAGAVEPFRLCLRRPAARSWAWPSDRPPLRIGVLSDLHASWPSMGPPRIARIAARLAAERPDLVLLPGDFVSTHTALVRPVPVEATAAALVGLVAAAPTIAVLGNH